MINDFPCPFVCDLDAAPATQGSLDECGTGRSRNILLMDKYGRNVEGADAQPLLQNIARVFGTSLFFGWQSMVMELLC